MFVVFGVHSSWARTSVLQREKSHFGYMLVRQNSASPGDSDVCSATGQTSHEEVTQYRGVCLDHHVISPDAGHCVVTCQPLIAMYLGVFSSRSDMVLTWL
jgi:hypothetical protein